MTSHDPVHRSHPTRRPGPRHPLSVRFSVRSAAPLAFILLTGALLSCSSDAVSPPDDDDDDDDPIVSVTVTPSSDEIEIEGTTSLSASVLTQAGADVTSSTTISWSSSAGSVASVSGNGATAVVSAVSPGTATIQASASGRNGSAQVTVRAPAPDITTASLAGGRVGEPYHETLEVTGGDGTFVWIVTVGALPDGLGLDAATGAIDGTPTAAGSFDFTVEVTSGGRSDARALGITVAPVSDGEVRTAVVNVDWVGSTIELPEEDIYVGDDGVFSTAGGTYWNPVDGDHDRVDAADEFEVPTSVDVAPNVNGIIFIGDATNELQEDGIISGGIPDHGFEWRGLVEDGVYDLAFYVYAQAALGAVTSLDVTHASGVTTLGPNGVPSWQLPGQEGNDYLFLLEVGPFEIEPGVWGFRIDELDERGAIMGAQLRGPVRDP